MDKSIIILVIVFFSFPITIFAAGEKSFFITNSAASEIMTVMNTGLIGFGTVSPTGRFSLYDGGTTATSMFDIQTDDDAPWGMRILNRTYSTNFLNAFTILQLNTGAVTFGNRGSYGMVFGTGRVGIGNTLNNPIYRLDIYGSSNASVIDSAAIRLQDASGNSNSREWVIGNGYTDYGSLDFVTGTSSSALPTTLIKMSLTTTRLSTTGELKANDYFSGDGTQGYTGTCTILGLTSIIVKDGLITSCI